VISGFVYLRLWEFNVLSLFHSKFPTEFTNRSFLSSQADILIDLQPTFVLPSSDGPKRKLFGFSRNWIQPQSCCAVLGLGTSRESCDKDLWRCWSFDRLRLQWLQDDDENASRCVETGMSKMRNARNHAPAHLVQRCTLYSNVETVHRTNRTNRTNRP